MIQLNLKHIEQIIDNDDIFSQLKQIAHPYPHPTYTRQIDMQRHRACVDDRPASFVIRLVPNKDQLDKQQTYFELNGRFYQLKHFRHSQLDKRNDLGARPWPGGAFGLNLIVGYAGIISGTFQQQEWWSKTDVNQFLSGLITSIMTVVNTIPGSFNLPIHIDNHSGSEPILNERADPHIDVLMNLFKEGAGCGFLKKIIEILHGLLVVTKHTTLADELRHKLHGQVTKEGLLDVTEYVTTMTAGAFYKTAKRWGCPVEVLIGHHAPQGIIFTFGNKTVNRQLVEDAFDQTDLEFKIDLGPLKNPSSLANQYIQAISHQFDISLDPLQLVTAINLLTLVYLNQQSTPRYYLD